MADIDITRWDHFAWMCPHCGYGDNRPSRLRLVDSRDLSIDREDIWTDEFNAGLYELRHATDPVVYCSDCDTVFDVEFTARDGAEADDG